MKELRGTGVAIVTPFDANGQVDYVAFSGLIETYIHADRLYCGSGNDSRNSYIDNR